MSARRYQVEVHDFAGRDGIIEMEAETDKEARRCGVRWFREVQDSGAPIAVVIVTDHEGRSVVWAA